MKSGCTGWLKGRPWLTIECVLTNIVCGVGGQGVLLTHWQPLSEHHVSRLGVVKRKPLLQCNVSVCVWSVCVESVCVCVCVGVCVCVCVCVCVWSVCVCECVGWKEVVTFSLESTPIHWCVKSFQVLVYVCYMFQDH